MRKAVIALGISVGAVVVGFAVCVPGVCGCVSWLGIPDLGEYGILFFFLAMAGMAGICISLCWLLVSGVVSSLRHQR